MAHVGMYYMWQNIEGVKYLQIDLHLPKFNLQKFCLRNILIKTHDSES